MRIMRHTERGTTVQELIVTLGMLSILASVGGYGLSQVLPNYRLSSAARSLLFHIQEARSRAAYRSAICYLDFDSDGDGNVGPGRCVLWEDLNANKQKDPQEREEPSFGLKEFPVLGSKSSPTSVLRPIPLNWADRSVGQTIRTLMPAAVTGSVSPRIVSNSIPRGRARVEPFIYTIRRDRPMRFAFATMGLFNSGAITGASGRDRGILPTQKGLGISLAETPEPQRI